MADILTILGILGAALFFVWLGWMKQYSPTRGTLAILCRIGWIFPVVSAFFPKSSSKALPRTMSLRPLHIFLDDSQSMNLEVGNGNGTKLGAAERYISTIESECQRVGCLPKVTKLSD